MAKVICGTCRGEFDIPGAEKGDLVTCTNPGCNAEGEIRLALSSGEDDPQPISARAATLGNSGAKCPSCKSKIEFSSPNAGDTIKCANCDEDSTVVLVAIAC